MLLSRLKSMLGSRGPDPSVSILDNENGPQKDNQETDRILPGRKITSAKFMKGEITGNETPKSVHESEALFREHRLSNFKTCYNNMAKEFINSNGKSLSRNRFNAITGFRPFW